METEILRLWNIVSEIVEQLNQNKLITSKLQSQAGQLQEHAGQVSDGVTLRRFNTDISKESFTSELERISTALVMENQSLLHENKQLNALLQEYEKTLQTVMEKFKGHCHAAQTHQLTLTRHYETLLSRDRGEEPPAVARLMMDAGEHFQSLTSSVVRALRSMDGKDPLQEEDEETQEHAEGDEEDGEEEADTDEDEVEDHDGADHDGADPEDAEATEESYEGLGDWAEEREIEIQRLEKENKELRRMLGISPEQERELGLDDDDRYSPTTPSPFAARRNPFSPSGSGFGSLREDRERRISFGNGGRASLGLGFNGEQRRPVFRRGGWEGEPPRIRPVAPERALSPPNEIRWGRDAPPGPLVESI